VPYSIRRVALVVLAAVVLGAPGPAVASFRSRSDVDPSAIMPGSGPGPLAIWSPLAPRGVGFGLGSALVGSAPAVGGSSELADDPLTHTLYVANGNNDNGDNGAGGDTVSVIDTRRCQTHDVSRCVVPWPTITVGTGTPDDLPGGIAIDEATDTVYVANVGANTVSVIDGATCNALDTQGCGQTPVNVPVGLGPINLSVDPANHTLYVANFDAPPLGDNNSTSVSMIDTTTCNAGHLSGCPSTPPPTVDVANPPDQVTIDRTTHTVYVTTLAGWSVFDADTCNASVHAGCSAIGFLAGDPNGPNDGQIDPSTETMYTANYDKTVSAFDLRDCDAANLAGCATDTPGIVTFPQFPTPDLYVAVDPALDTVYVSFQNDDVLGVIDTRTCRTGDLAGCASQNPSSVHTGADPEGVVLDPTTPTLYTANDADADVSVIDPGQCNAHTTRGCRHPAPWFGVDGPQPPAADPAVHTVYIPDAAGVALVDARRCNAARTAGCAFAPTQVAAGENPFGVAIDRRTGTDYVAKLRLVRHGRHRQHLRVRRAHVQRRDARRLRTIRNVTRAGRQPGRPRRRLPHSHTLRRHRDRQRAGPAFGLRHEFVRNQRRVRPQSGAGRTGLRRLRGTPSAAQASISGSTPRRTRSTPPTSSGPSRAPTPSTSSTERPATPNSTPAAAKPRDPHRRRRPSRPRRRRPHRHAVRRQPRRWRLRRQPIDRQRSDVPRQDERGLRPDGRDNTRRLRRLHDRP